MPWTSEGRAWALENYGVISATEIAEVVRRQYGCAGVTRNAVIGIAKRAGKCVSMNRIEQTRRLRKLVKTAAQKAKPLPAPRGGHYVPEAERSDKPKGIIVEFQTRALPQVPIEEPKNVSLLDLSAGQCRAITGSDADGGALFCGHRAEKGRSWCAGHASRFHCLPVKSQKRALYAPSEGRVEKAKPVALKQILAG